MGKMKTASWKAKVMLAAILVVILSFSIFSPALASAETKAPPAEHESIVINNGLIDIRWFGETASSGWYYPALTSNVFSETAAVACGGNLPVPLWMGTLVRPYPNFGVPNTWYHAAILLDLDLDTVNDVQVQRSIMVPSGKTFFYVRYMITNIGPSYLTNLRFFQGADYDIRNFTNDEGGYAGGLTPAGFVWTHDVGDGINNWVGFKGSLVPCHHSVASYWQMWTQVYAGVLNDANYFRGDPGVALEWHLGVLPVGYAKGLTVKFAFAHSMFQLALQLMLP